MSDGTTPGQIDDMFVSLGTNLRRFKQEFAAEFQQRVQARTPVRTGNLKGGWITQTTARDFTISNTAVNEEGEPYAAYLEFGTPKIAPVAMIQTTLLEAEDIAKVAKERAGIKS